MKRHWSRRRLLQTSGVFLGSGAWGQLVRSSSAAPVISPTYEEAEIERLAEAIMDTAPERIVDFVVEKIGRGLSRQRLLAACFNAGSRFHGHHSAYVAHPIRVVADEINTEASLLPLFYYLSVLRFRSAKPDLRAVDEGKLPPAGKAEAFFQEAMRAGDRTTATQAMIAMSRDIGPQQAYQHLWMYGAERNHNSGGHTAISVANNFRSLVATDWRCAEAAMALSVHDAARAPSGGGEVHRINRQRADQVSQLPAGWSRLASDEAAVRELLDVYRKGNPRVACEATFEMLRDGQIHAGTVWDAVFLTTAELIVRYQWVGSKMLAGHSVTCANGLHFMFRSVTEPKPRLYAMLEAVEWTTSFLDRERRRPALRDVNLLEVQPAEFAADDDALESIFSLLPPRRFAHISRNGLGDVDRAMQIALGWAQRQTDYRPFLQTAQHLMCVKSTPEVHDFKFPMALFENCRYASPRWQPYLLAASVHVLQGTEMEDSQIVQQARQRLEID